MKKKFIRFVLSEDDTDLIGWKNSLLPRSFTETVNNILVSESIGQIARIPYEFSSSEVADKVKTGFCVADENVFALLNGIKKGDRTDVIKEIIRKHIQHNREHPPELVSVDLLHSIVVDFRNSGSRLRHWRLLWWRLHARNSVQRRRQSQGRALRL